MWGEWVGMSGDDCGQWMNHRMVGFGVICVSEVLADFVRWDCYLSRLIFGGSAVLGGV